MDKFIRLMTLVVDIARLLVMFIGK